MTDLVTGRLLQRKLLIDWGRGTSADLDAYTDVTGAILKESMTVGWGRDQARSTAPPRAEFLNAILNNHDGTYSNAAGPLATFVNRGPTVDAYFEHSVGVTVDSLDVTLEDLTWTLDDPEDTQIFTGQIEHAPQSLDALKTVSIDALGNLRYFNRKKITIPLLENVTVDQILGYICDAVGFPADKRVFDVGDTIILFFWMAEELPISRMLQLLAAEGSNATLYTDNQGNLVFEGRQYRVNNYRSNTTQYYLYDAVQASAPLGQPIYHSPSTSFNQSPDEVYNKVTATVNTRAIATGLTQVWSYGSSLVLSPGESKTVFTSLSEPVKDAVVPTVTTDYIVAAGSVASITLSYTSGSHIGITVTAGGSGCTLTGPTGQETLGFFLRAKLVARVSQVDVIQTVDTQLSIDRYLENEYSIGLWPEINPNTVQDIVNGIATRYSEPRDQMNITVHNLDAAHALFIMNSKISDRINILSTHQGVNEAFFIESKQIQINNVGNVICTLGCEKAIDQDAFRFGEDNFGENVFGE